ncbi:MAG: VanW family protein [Clostridia bacterium]|nr:VanW family protein [Clostridia bacterium]
MRRSYGALCIVLTLLLIGGCATGEDKIGISVEIDGMEVDGLTEYQAHEKLSYHYARVLADKKLVITTTDGRTATTSADKLGVTFDYEDAVARAMSLSYLPWNGTSGRSFDVSMQIDKDAIKRELTRITAEFNSQPQDAAFRYNPRSETFFDIASEKNGTRVDIDGLVEQVSQALMRNEELSFETELTKLEAQYTLQDAQADCAMLCEFTTEFADGSLAAENRVLNIEKGAKLIDGYELEPGEEFDINAVLGARNEENGWYEAPGIVHGRYQPEYGGGICQVSTTLYNAALLARLTITERHHHSWPMGYIAIGQDATISTGGPNLRFVNSSEHAIVISALTDSDNKTLTVRIFGRDYEDGYRVELKSAKLKQLPQPDAEYKLDTNLPPNTTECYRKGRAGSVSETYIHYYDAEGELVKKELVSRDTYKPISAIYYVSEDVYYAMQYGGG